MLFAWLRNCCLVEFDLERKKTAISSSHVICKRIYIIRGKNKQTTTKNGLYLAR